MSPEAVVDTVILRYFAFVDALDLLLRLLGDPLAVPRIVYDPDEPPSTPEDARSEITRSIHFQRRASADPARGEQARTDASCNANRLEQIAVLHRQQRLTVVDLSQDELAIVAQLTTATVRTQANVRFPLDAGEAACVAIAISRNLTLATDDSDALTVLHSLSSRHPYERIRKLLTRAGEQELCTTGHANSLHAEMCRLGFWDRHAPFP